MEEVERMTKVFNETGDFAAFYAASSWLRENGYSFGSMQRENPIGIMKGDWYISKWTNMSSDEIRQLDGRIIGDMRNGPVTVTIKDPK